MDKVRFYLKSKVPSTGKCLILLVIKANNKRFLYTFNTSVYPSLWDKENQRMSVDTEGVNDLLDAISDLANKSFEEHSDFVKVKTDLDARYRTNKSITPFVEENTEFYDLINTIIRNGKLSDATIKNYERTASKLKEFESNTGYVVMFSTIDANFYFDFLRFASEQGYKHNTIKTYIKCVVSVMNVAIDEELTDNMIVRTKKFAIPQESIKIDVLTEDEMLSISTANVSTTLYGIVRDTFILMCKLGIRYVDAVDLSIDQVSMRNNVKYLHTSKGCTIKIDDSIEDQIRNFDGHKLPSPQVFNKYLKKICDGIGINKKINSQSGFDTMISNMKLSNKSLLEMLSVTGYTHKAFEKYNKTHHI